MTSKRREQELLQQRITELEQAESNLRQAEETLLAQNRRLETLNAVAQVTTGTLSPSLICERLLDIIRKALPCDAFFVYTRNTEVGLSGYLCRYDTMEGELTCLDPPGTTSRPGTITLSIMESQEPKLILRDDSSAPDDGLVLFGNSTKRSASIMFAPFIVGRSACGLISVQSYQPNAYTPDDLNLLMEITQQAGPAVEASVLSEQINKTESQERLFGEKLATLVDVANHLSVAESFEDLCLQVILLGHNSLGFRRMSLWFISDDRQTALGSYAIGIGGEVKNIRGTEFSLDPSKKIFDVSQGKVPLGVFRDVELSEGSEVVGRGTLVAAAVRDREQAIGLLLADDLLAENLISEYQCELLRLYASAVGSLLASKRREDELKQAHQIYCEAIENTRGVPYRLNYLKEEYDFVGQGCEELFGIPASEFTHERFREMHRESVPVDPDDVHDLEERARAFKTGERKRYRADIRVVTPKGEEKWLSDCSVPIHDEKTGEIIGSLGILQDITERRSREEEYKRMHKIYYEAIENAQGIPYRLNYTTGNYEFVGQNCEQIIGVPANELTAERLRNMILENIPTDPNAPLDPEERNRVYRLGKMPRYRADMRLKTPRGDEIWLTDYAVPIRDAQTGEVIGSLGILQDITDRKRQEDELRRTHQAYCKAIDNAQGVPYRLDYVSGQYEFIGEGCERILGVPANELTCKRLRAMVVENIPTNEDEPEDPAERDRMFRDGRLKGYRADIRIITPQGREKWLIDCSVPIPDERTGEITKSLGILQDITDRKLQEETLKAAHRAYCEAIDNAQGVPYRLNYKSGQYEFVGEGCERILGIPASELTAKRFREMVLKNTPTDTSEPQAADERDQEFRAGKLRRYRADVLIKTPSGEEKWLTDCSVPIHDEISGEIVGSLGILQDITERKRQEEAIKKAHKDYCEAIQGAQGVPYRLDYASGQYEFVGEECERIIGIPASELTAKRFREMVQENVPAESGISSDAKERDRMFRRGELKRYRADLRILTPNGQEKWLTDCSVPIRDDKTGEITGSLGILQDITDRKRTERALLATSRMEATSTLAGGVAHDFNNLMVAVLGNAELLKMGFGNNQEAEEMLDNISHAAQRAGDLAQQMLAFARGGKYQPKVLNLNTSVNETLQIQARAFPPRIAFEKDTEPALWNIEADPAQMSQVIMNLCINAVEAIEGNGTITITTRNVEVDDEDGHLHQGMKPGRYVYLSVQDTGRGMTQETMSRVFEPFFTTKFQGRGLGLAAVYGIVKNHGGEILVYSEKNKGTTFKIYLPSTHAESRKLSEIKTENIKGAETILIIDDEEAVIDVTKRILERLGYCVLVARNGRESVDIAHRYPGDIHLALLDMGMPVMGGAEAFPLLLESRPKMKIIICSGYELDASSQALLDAGAESFLQKPFQARVLGRQIRNAMDQ